MILALDYIRAHAGDIARAHVICGTPLPQLIRDAAARALRPVAEATTPELPWS